MSFFTEILHSTRRTKEAKSRSVIDLAGAVLALSADGVVLDASSQFLALTGLDRIACVGQPLESLIAPDQARTVIPRSLWADLAAAQPAAERLKLRRKDGSWLWSQVQFVPILSDSGALMRIDAFFSDISDAAQRRALERGTLSAVDRSIAVIEFDPTGTVLTANDNFLACIGYTLAEIVGRKHVMFLTEAESQSAAYGDFWKTLAAGGFVSGAFRRIGKSKREIWLQASYNPIFDEAGHVIKVVKFAFDITEQRALALDSAGQLAALGKSQAVIEFDMAGRILTANDGFLDLMGYSLAEVRGRHHSLFVAPEEVADPSYTKFWADLNAGQFKSAEFARKKKSGDVVWLQATYNPILNIDGKPFKVVKFATDVSARKYAVQALQKGMERLAEGDLTVALSEPFGAEYELLRLDFNKTLKILSQTISDVVSAIKALNSNAGDISKSSQDLARRTEGQAARLEEIAAALAEMTATVRSSADSASQAHRATSDAIGQADTSCVIMNDASLAMEEIKSSSDEISKILRVIDDIAFQTNLLALNAGVEAARAGDAGRGFAVVASEVRALSIRSGEAAGEIRSLIGKSVGHVKKGGDLVGKTGAALTEISVAVKKVGELVASIAGLSSEQATGVSELNKAVGTLDQLTQRNAAMAEEATAATEMLREEANSLATAISRFVVPETAAFDRKFVA